MAFLCTSCGSHEIHTQQHTVSFEHNGKTLNVLQNQSFCAACGTFVGMPSEGRLNARAIQREKNISDGLLLGGDIRAFRQKYCLDQSEASRLFGGGPTAFAKYEVDEISHTKAMDHLLRLCINNPFNLIDLAKDVGVTLKAETRHAIFQSQIGRSIHPSVWLSLGPNIYRKVFGDGQNRPVAIDSKPSTAEHSQEAIEPTQSKSFDAATVKGWLCNLTPTYHDEVQEQIFTVEQTGT